MQVSSGHLLPPVQTLVVSSIFFFPMKEENANQIPLTSKCHLTALNLDGHPLNHTMDLESKYTFYQHHTWQQPYSHSPIWVTFIVTSLVYKPPFKLIQAKEYGHTKYNNPYSTHNDSSLI